MSIGLLIDLDYVVEHWVMVTSFAFGAVLLKTVLNVLLVRYVGFEWAVALPTGLATAQIGEFSFILANLGVDLGLLPERGRDLILAGAILSILANPAIFAAISRFKIAAALAPAVGSPEGESAAVAELVEFLGKSIRFTADEQYTQEQFDVVLL